MPDLAALGAFGHIEARRHRFGPIVMRENAALGLASLAVPRRSPAPVLGGVELPGPGAWVGGPAFSAFWIAPNQWMLEVADGAGRELESELAAMVPGSAVTGQTDGWVVLEVTSEAGPRPLDKACEKLVNLDPARFGPGSATRTGIEHMSVFVIRRSPTSLAVLGMRSMAGSLWHALETAIARVAEG